MYSVLMFGEWAADGVRMDAYARALARTVRPGSVVADLGARTGILSLLAARAGARRVHAIESSPAVSILRELAAENGLADRIVLHQATSLEVELPERAEVIVSDLRGGIPLFRGRLASLRDAKARLLAPGGTLLPQRDTLLVALVEQEALWERLARSQQRFEAHGFSAAAARASVLHTPTDERGLPLPASAVLGDAKPFPELRYGEDHPGTFERTVELTMTRGGTAHALVVLFEATLVDGIGYSTAPGASTVYRRTVLPLLEPVRVSHGEVARVSLRVDADGDGWVWNTEIAGRRYRQASFLGVSLSREARVPQAPTFVPTLSERGERARRILELVDGTRSVTDVADALGGTEALLGEVQALVLPLAR